MVEAWFSPEIAPYFSLLSLFSLLACLQTFAMKGTRRELVMGAYYAATGASALLALAALPAPRDP